MSENKYTQYNVNKILSVNPNPNKVNAALINGQYFFQIENTFEENDDQIVEYQNHYELIEDGEYAQVTCLKDLYFLCISFQLEDEITYILMFQFLKFVQRDKEFIISNPSSQKQLLSINPQFQFQYGLNDDDDYDYDDVDVNFDVNFDDDDLDQAMFGSLNQRGQNQVEKKVEQSYMDKIDNFIYNHGINLIHRSIDFPRNQTIKENIGQYFSKHFLIHPSIIEVQFDPMDIQKIENQILDKQTAQISSKEQTEFMNWMKLIDSKIITYNTVFNHSFELDQDDIWDSSRIHSDLNKKTNGITLSNKNFEILQSNNKLSCFFLQNVLHQCKNSTDNTGFDLAAFTSINIQPYNFQIQSINNQSNNFNLHPIAQESGEPEVKKVFLEVKKVEDNTYKYVTRSLNFDQVSYLFLPASSMTYKTKLTPKLIQQIQSKIYQNNSIIIVGLSIQNLSFNVDYSVIDKVLELPTVANYLKTRKVIYKNPHSKQEEEIIMKKGILIGDPFYDVVLYQLSKFIEKALSSVLTNFFPNFESYNYNDDFLFVINGTKENDQNLVKQSLKLFLQISELLLMNLGLRLNQEKTKVLSRKSQELYAWNADKQFDLIETNEFKIFDKDLMVLSRSKTVPSKKLKQYVFSIIRDLENNNKNIESFFSSYSDLQKCFTIKFFEEYLQYNPSFQSKSVLKSSIEYLKKVLQLQNPFYFQRQLD